MEDHRPLKCHSPHSQQKQLQINRTYCNIPRPEEELPVEVGFLNCVHVSHSHLSTWPTPQTYHSKVLQQLTANGTSTNLRVGKSRNVNKVLGILTKA